MGVHDARLCRFFCHPGGANVKPDFLGKVTAENGETWSPQISQMDTDNLSGTRNLGNPPPIARSLFLLQNLNLRKSGRGNLGR